MNGTLTLIDTGKSFYDHTDMVGDTESIWEGDGVVYPFGEDDVLGMSFEEQRQIVEQYQWYCHDGMLTAEDCPKTMVAVS